MRGKPNLHRAGKFGGRNIPAYAGKTPTTAEVAGAIAEHPRVCGENSAMKQ